MMIYKGSFEDILFVLAGLIWVGYSAYRANNKKGKKSTASSGKNKPASGSFFDELLSQFETTDATVETINSENDTMVATPDVNRESIIDNSQPFSYDDKFEQGNRNSNLYAQPEVLDEFKDQNIKNAYSQEEKKEGKKSFNLKSAFIYSEILKQKYI